MVEKVKYIIYNLDIRGLVGRFFFHSVQIDCVRSFIKIDYFLII